jgi:hypothetical protein
MTTALTDPLPPLPPPDPALQYRMQKVFATADGATLADEPVFLRSGIENDDSAFEAFGRLLGHFYDGQPNEHFVLLAPGGRLMGVF